MSSTRQQPSPPDPPRRAGRILSIDYGRKRIGLAISDERGVIARPLATLQRTNLRDDLRRLGEIVRQHDVRLIVVGHPLKLDGTRGEMAAETEAFAARIGKEYGLRVERVDERLTSHEAEEMIAKGLSVRRRRSAGKKSKGAPGVDAVAAAVILRDYLARPGGSG